jgi:hypothetical protein
MAVRAVIVGPGLWLLLVGTVVGWVALNQFGFFENGRMRASLERILRAKEGDLPDDRMFVGYASPKYAGLIDAHEDVGFLCFLPDRLRFVSEVRTVDFPFAQIRRVRFRPNAHSLLGLGRWVSIEGRAGKETLEMKVEPRERRTMLANFRLSRPLRDRIRAIVRGSV